MRIHYFVAVSVVALSLGAAISAQMPKYGITVETANKAALANIKTYAWIPGQPAFDKAVDKQIVTAIDRELAALGMKPATANPNAQVMYMSVRRTDVDLKAKPDAETGALRQYPVGTLVVSLMDPTSKKAIFTARSDQPIVLEPAKMEAIVNAAVGAIFEKYPRPASGK